MTDQIEANYEELEQVQKQFQELEQKAKTLRGRIIVAYHEIKDGAGWEGQGAKAFIDEMENDILASTANLGTAMNAIAATIGNIATKFKDAEEAVRSGANRVSPGSP